MFPEGTDEMCTRKVVTGVASRTTFLTGVSETANLQVDTFDWESSPRCLFVLSDSKG